jgi:hypothetical protein
MTTNFSSTAPSPDLLQAPIVVDLVDVGDETFAT